MSFKPDSKQAPLMGDDELAAPPSYAESAANTSTFGDGHIFTDAPRPTMAYSAAVQESYTPRSEQSSWSSSFFGCFSHGSSCMKAAFCPCVSYGQTRHRLSHPGEPAPIFSGACTGYTISACCLPGSQYIFGMLQRNWIRQHLNIDQPKKAVRMDDRGDSGRAAIFEGVQQTLGFLDDAMRHVFCHCCSLAQEEREVLQWEREELEGAFARGDLERGPNVVGDEQVRAEGERLLGAEQEGLQGLRG